MPPIVARDTDVCADAKCCVV